MTTKEAKTVTKNALRKAINELLDAEGEGEKEWKLAKRLYNIYWERFESAITAMEEFLAQEDDEKEARRRSDKKKQIKQAIELGDKKTAKRLYRSYCKKYSCKMAKIQGLIDSMEHTIEDVEQPAKKEGKKKKGKKAESQNVLHKGFLLSVVGIEALETEWSNLETEIQKLQRQQATINAGIKAMKIDAGVKG